MNFDFGHLWSLFLGTIIGILPISNPLAATPVFLAITRGDSKGHRRSQARRACIYMMLILSSFLLFGTLIMQVFSISIPGIRIAGGILVARIGMEMLGGTLGTHDKANHPAALNKQDISFSPLALPMLSGPGSIGITLGYTSLAKTWYDYLAIIAGICVVALVAYLTLLGAARIVRLVGPIGMNAFTQIMGLLIMFMGVQFIVDGVIGVISHPDFLRLLHPAQ